MSERLQEIKERWKGEYPKSILGNQIDWLIEQAEILERLQEQTLYSDFINRINELEEEIKHLKEARKENQSGPQHETHTILDRGAE